MGTIIKIAYLSVVYSEDSLDFHEFIGQVLNRPDFQVFSLLSKNVTIEEVVALKPNIILMDLRRPNSPNLELSQKIVESEELSHLPLLVITEKGYDSTPLGFGCTMRGDYVCYPLFDKLTFLSIVQRLSKQAESSA